MNDAYKKLSRRKFMGSVAGLGASASLIREAGAQQKKLDKINVTNSNGLNLIVIVADTIRTDYLSFNGNNSIHTPNLEALAKEGIYFSNCYADGLPTMAARWTMHTGKSHFPGNPQWKPLDPGDISFAEVLSKSNFTTGLITDNFHYFMPDFNYHRAFNSWEWISGQQTDSYKCGPKKSVNPEDYSPKHLLHEVYRENIIQYILNTKDWKSEEDYFSAQVANKAVTWLEEVKDNDGSFMLYLDFFNPHEAWDAPQRFKKMYRKKYPLERFIFNYHVDVKKILPDDIPVLTDLYSASITFCDYCVGKIIEEVKRMGLWENTIIVFTSDHGTHLGEQGCIQKHSKFLTSTLARVPLIIRHPDMSARGKRIDALVSWADLMPTFLSLLGVEGYKDMDGFNTMDLVTGNKKKNRDYVYTGYRAHGSIHNHKWHYFDEVWGPHKDHAFWDIAGTFSPALYNLEKDPKEEHNVVKKYPDVVVELKHQMEKAFGKKLT